ncbi:ribokinase [Exiguobacterium sp. SH3S2]|uniref:ribokinase n=1 Tax=Exiguobacterium TaxID=33986 RepID=UPI0008775B4C|nr:MULTISPECIES: ribokinase [Exiguobacterium]TCI36517.1 ribokinase [Exiguobacterium sp. SH4S7]TCI43155.1 ribokinase [Exiguobacterium sp. SH3S3]TCI48570.1 ribokinase [Exiguobacterium sp. SH5S32]TCI55456.1 ribokinase [Exiguobacterium sp. SH1S4]TCI58926.1 ribokinase [Exiguobacterium sp. SH3S2]
MNRIVVIGSVSMDLVVTTNKRPQAGETVIGNTFQTVPGGKGANQAVAAARLGGQVEMVGCVGSDEFGNIIRQNFKQNQVGTRHLRTIGEEVTGTAHIVLADGDNSIVVVQSANKHVRFTDVELEQLLDDQTLVLLQLEIPIETVEQVSTYCHQRNIPVLLNPAPSQALTSELLEKVTYVTPNEHECRDLFGDLPIEDVLRRYPNKLIVTEGVRGVRFFDGKTIQHIPAILANVVDTTGAGDTFNGALAVSLVEGNNLEEAARFAVVASGMSVEGFGAQGGMPNRADVMRRLERV